ncbi:nitroreductase family protein [candidate division WOR-3 bacterium]|nr:nitroreductase family protein [candidate division WOR-3 bacterium]
MMDIFEIMRWRRSVRKFAPKKIELEKLRQILEMARIAPSSSNRQAWHFIVIDDPAIIKEIPKQVAMGDKVVISWLKDAPCVIAGCYTKAVTHHIATMFGHNNHLIDVAIAMTHICLAATALGIGSCFVGWFNTKRLKKLLGLPAHYQISVLLALGYPADGSTDEGIGGIKPRARKEFDDVVSLNRYGQKLRKA